ncbi:hypothetical protein AD23_5307, partial [Escherichia coli 2-005-03_S4_C3]
MVDRGIHQTRTPVHPAHGTYAQRAIRRPGQGHYGF